VLLACEWPGSVLVQLGTPPAVADPVWLPAAAAAVAAAVSAAAAAASACGEGVNSRGGGQAEDTQGGSGRRGGEAGLWASNVGPMGGGGGGVGLNAPGARAGAAAGAAGPRRWAGVHLGVNQARQKN